MTARPCRWRLVLVLVPILCCASVPDAATGPGSPSTPEPTSAEPDDDGSATCEIAPPTTSRFGLIGVRVLTMDSDRPLEDHTVLVRDGRIERFGPSDATDVPAGYEAIDGCGRYLMPGLADMHVHVSRGDLPAYLAAGITTVRNMWGYPALPSLVAEVESGAIAGPTIYSVSPGLDGLPVKWPHTRLVLRPDAADSVVAEVVAEGWSTLKLYQDLGADVYDAIVEAARTRGVDFVGHVPHRVGLFAVLAAGQRSIEHLSGYEVELNPAGPRGAFGWTEIDESRIPELAQATSAAGTWNCPTMALFASFANGDSRIVQNRRAMLRALHESGARVLVGTDSGFNLATPGVSVHHELAEFVASGYTPFEALRAATVEAAEFLGESATFGRIAAGARADLLLLEQNPMADVSAASSPDLVIVRGRPFRP